MISFYKPNPPLLRTGPSKVNLKIPGRYNKYLSLFAKNKTRPEFSHFPPLLKKREWSLKLKPVPQESLIEKVDNDVFQSDLDQLKNTEQSFIEGLSSDEKQSTINDWYSRVFRSPLFRNLDRKQFIDFVVKSDYRLQLGVLLGMADEMFQMDKSNLFPFFPHLLSMLPKGLPEDRLYEIRDHLFSERALSCLNGKQLVEFIQAVYDQKELIQGDYANFFVRIGTFVRKYMDQNSYSKSIFSIYGKMIIGLDFRRIAKKEALLLANGFFLNRLILSYMSEQEKDDHFLILLNKLKEAGIEKNEGELLLKMAFSVDDENKKYPRGQVVPWIYEFFLEETDLSELSKEDQSLLFFRLADSLMQMDFLPESDILHFVKVFKLDEEEDKSWIWSHEIFRNLSVKALDQINQSS